MMPNRFKAARYYLTAAIVLILLVLNIYVVKTLVIFGSPVLFLFAIFLEIVLLGVLLYAVIRALATPENILKSLLVSLWGGLQSNDYIRKLRQSDAPFLAWTRRRFKRDSPGGLLLTGTVVVAAIPLFSFLSLLLTVVNRGSLTGVDQRILNLIPSVRTNDETIFFSIVTVLANVQSIVLLTVATVIVSWWKHQRPLAVLFAAAVAAEEAIAFLVKHVVARTRPESVLSLIEEDSYSFPSGHAVRATVVFGLLAYLIYKTYRSTPARILTIGLYILTVFLVALSRVYLGVHYPTDAWGGILLGSSLLALLIGALEISSRHELIKRQKIRLENRSLMVVPVAVAVFAALASPLLIHPQTTTVQPSYATLPALDECTVQQLPIYSETLTGERMEPISFIYAGSEDQIIGTFKSHGWDQADPSTLTNTLRALAVGFQGGQYPDAPVTPSFLNSQPEKLAFQQATATQSLRQRHHTRLWQTGYALTDGRPIWVATASFDDGIELSGTVKLPTHHIDPNIDAERSYIINSLGYPTHLLTVTQPELGKNASGDSFFTDGKAELIYLR